jgi:hypothetical protein
LVGVLSRNRYFFHEHKHHRAKLVHSIKKNHHGKAIKLGPVSCCCYNPHNHYTSLSPPVYQYISHHGESRERKVY